MSHACEDEDQMVEEVVVCEDATLRYVTNTHARIEWADGRTEEHDLSSCDRHLSPRFDMHRCPLSGDGGCRPGEGLTLQNFRYFFRYVRGEVERPLVTLADTVSFVQLLGLLYVSYADPPSRACPPLSDRLGCGYVATCMPGRARSRRSRSRS